MREAMLNSSEETDTRWQIASRAVESLVSNSISVFHGFFDWGEETTPSVQWKPDEEAMPSEAMRSAHSCWGALGQVGENETPHYRDFDILQFHDAMGYLIYLDVLGDGTDFRYRVYGGRISHYSGFDLTGQTLSRAKIPDVTREFMGACYMAVVRRPEPLLTVHTSPRDFLMVSWSRLILPLINDAGVVTRLLVCNVPSKTLDGFYPGRSVYKQE